MTATVDNAVADLQRANVELKRQLDERTAERDEALEQQTATAEVLQVINSSPGDLIPVFAAMLEKAMRLCEAAFGIMFMVDGDRIRIVAEREVPKPLSDYLVEHPPEIGLDTLLGRSIRARKILHTADPLAGEPYRAGVPLAVKTVELGNVRALLMAPLLKDNEVLGVFAIFRQEARAFSDKQIALLENFAAQAVIAMENARLITETREALEQQTATAEVLQVINSSPGDLAPVFDAMLEKAMRLCEAAFGTLLTYDGGRFAPAASCGVPPAFAVFRDDRGAFVPPPGSSLERVVNGESPVHIADVTKDPGQTATPLVELGGCRTLVCVALRKDNCLIGAITAYRQELRPFTDKQIALLQNFAAQAVIAMENARLITETREALEQQTATAEVLQVINSSPGDLTPVFDTILEKAASLCEAAFGVLLTYDGAHFHHGALRAVPGTYGEFMRENPPDYGPGTGPGRILAGERVVHVADMMETDLYRSGDPNRRALVDLAGARSVVLVPLLKDDVVCGIINVFRQEVRPFTDKQVALLQNFAAQAAIAMENARLITETQEALDQQTATAEVLQVINSSPGDLTPVFDAMLEKALRLCEAACGHLYTYGGERFHPTVMRGDASFAEWWYQHGPVQAVPGGGFLGRILEGERVISMADVKESVGYSIVPAFKQLVDASGLRSGIGIALRNDNALLGAITIYRQEVRPFTEKQIALMQNFAAQAVIAMENARLITETREALAQQTATAEVLQVINASSGDPTPVFDAILDKAHQLFGATRGTLFLFDGETFRAAAMHGYPPPAEGTPPRAINVSEDPRLAALVAGERLIYVPDLTQVDDPIARAVAERGGVRTNLLLPLCRDGVLVGVISCNRHEVQPFSDRDIALLENFAAQAVIAMENARLLTETREALEQQTATAEVLRVITASPGDLAPVFNAMLEKAMHLCDAAFGQLGVYDGELLAIGAVRGPPDIVSFMKNRGPVRPIKGHTSTIERLSRGEDVIHIVDAKDDAAYREGNPNRRALVDLGGCRTLLNVALREDHRLLGTIEIYRQELRPFSDKEIALLQNFAAQAVIAMENARLLRELHQRTEEIAELNRGLEARVAEQVEELGRIGNLKRFLPPQVAEMVVSQGDERILESHRREIVVVFCDVRGYTAFSETAEPEEVIEFLSEYHAALGPLITRFEGTLSHFFGDGLMVFFNDPVPCPDPVDRAVEMAMEMREAAGALVAAWRRRGHRIGFGGGIAQGYATLGQIGFADRSDYTAIGTVCNLAARLCGEAQDGQILVTQRIATAIGGNLALEELGPLPLKGLTQPVVAFNVPLGGSQRPFRVIEGGTPNG